MSVVIFISSEGLGVCGGGRGLARYDVGLQKAYLGLLTGDGMKRFWSGNPNVEGSNPSGPTTINHKIT